MIHGKLSRACLRVAFVLPLSLATLQAQAPPSYRVELLCSETGASDMNQGGVVVGSATIAGKQRAWIVSRGHPLVALPLPPGRVSSSAAGINDQGVIVGRVGSFDSPEFSGAAAIWTPNGGGGYTVQELGALPGHVSSHATALNNVGDVVGWSSDGTYRTPALFFPGGAPQSLGSTGVFDPQSINDSRVLVDRSWDGKLLDLSTMQVQSLGIPAGSYTSVMGYTINAPGQVSGVAYLATSTSCVQQSARHTDGVGWEVFGPCGTASGVADMNDQGDMTMVWTLTPVVRLNGLGTFVIESLIDVPLGHWYVSNYAGFRINDARQLVGPAHNPTTGESGLLLLTPETPVGTPLCFGDGGAGACPCGNSGSPGHGCQNSAATGGSLLACSGVASLSADTVWQTAMSELPTSLSIFLQGDTLLAPVSFGDGLRCTGGALERLYVKTAVGGVVTAPATGDAPVSARSAQLGDPIPSGGTRYYQVYYRDPSTTFCPSPSGGAFNVSNAVAIVWGN